MAPPDAQEMARRRDAILAAGYPYLVATDAAGRVLGYAYASAYRPRPAYRFAVENSVYVSPDAGRGGIGRALLAALITRCTAAGHRLMVAVIGDSANAASIGLHAGAGFTRAGLIPAVGWKHGRWVDSVLMVRPLGEGATAGAMTRDRASRDASIVLGLTLPGDTVLYLLVPAVVLCLGAAALLAVASFAALSPPRPAAPAGPGAS